VVALVAVALLLYAVLWLNARSNVRKWMGQVRASATGALGENSRVGLFMIAFGAAFRESFETAVFLQGLAIDSAWGTAWGAAAGVLALGALVLCIHRVGYRLPMKALFNASTVVLFATAVILLGKGLHALQEVGVLPLAPVPFIRIEALGIYDDAWSLGPQLVLLLAPLGFLAVRRSRRVGGRASSVEG
jgi:high-affinity iron transporter